MELSGLEVSSLGFTDKYKGFLNRWLHILRYITKNNQNIKSVKYTLKINLSKKMSELFKEKH